MRVSLRWLKEYIDVTDSPDRLAELLTMQGLEVESIDRQADIYAKFVVGRVLEVSKHPQADKLIVCKVDIASTQLQIVCGAPNVAAGQKVVVGLVGAVVPHDQHSPTGEPLTLMRVKLRGIESSGMICSASELGLGEDKSGILILDDTASPGQALADYLGMTDVIFEIGITPNRPDALSHFGIAREIGAFSGKKLRLPRLTLKETSTRTSDCVTVKIETPDDCPRYTARIIRNVKIAESPRWLKDLLNAVGIRPINNIVDISNYVLMEIGQPLHAFDYDRLTGKKIVVRRAGAQKSFVTLDGKQRTLRPETLLICDAERPVAIAGVMGGANTEISDSTTSILIESAHFHPQSIRRTSKLFGLTTDASQRFERGADPNVTDWAVDRAASLIQSTCGGEILKGIVDIYPRKIKPRHVPLRVDKTNELLGTTLSKKNILSLLSKLQIKGLSQKSSCRESAPKMMFEIPTFRPDLKREIDLIEEVARMYGYDKIETKTRTSLNFSTHAPETGFEDEVRDNLTGGGFREVVLNSMQDEAIASMGSLDFVRIANPVSKDMAALRTSLIPGMLGTVRDNVFHGTKSLRLFEIGKVYMKNPGKGEQVYLADFLEEERILVALSGLARPLSWSEKPQLVDLFDLRGEIESLFQKIFLDKYKFIPYSSRTKALTEYGLVVEINGESAGSLGMISSRIAEQFNVDMPVFVAELKLGVLKRARRVGLKYTGLPKYPEVLRDLAVVVDESVPVEQIIEDLWSTGRPLLKNVTLFDIYVGEQMEKRKKSCAFALEFQSQDQTLSQGEVDLIMRRMIESLALKFSARLRT